MREAKSISLWTGVLGAPVLWFAQFQLTYFVVPRICRNHHIGAFHIITVISVALIAACGLACWYYWRRFAHSSKSDDAPGAFGRETFLSILGIFTCVLFLLATIAQGIASFYISPCWD